MRLQHWILGGLFALVFAGTALAQDPSGYWNCEWGFQNTAPGVPANAVGGQFQMVVYPNGGAEGQGVEMGSSGQFPFQFQASWGMQGRMLTMQGQGMGGLAGGGYAFNFQSNFVSGTELAMTQNYANGQVYASRCIRTQ